MARRMSGMTAAFAEDHEFIARFVDIWRRPAKVGDTPFKEGTPCTPIFVNDIAWELNAGAAKVAVTMKWAAQNGWVRRTNARTEQAAYEPTEKALEQYPDGRAQVMPEPEKHKTKSGATVQGAPASEVRTWTGRDLAEGQTREADAIEPKKPFKGYLPEGN